MPVGFSSEFAIKISSYIAQGFQSGTIDVSTEITYSIPILSVEFRAVVSPLISPKILPGISPIISLLFRARICRGFDFPQGSFFELTLEHS